MRNSEDKGFTLVETLVVIAIIATLSVLSIGGYSQYRRTALVNLFTDSIVSQIKEFRDKSIYGNIATAKYDELKLKIALEDFEEIDSGSLCYGIYFQKADDNYQLFSFSQKFTNRKKWSERSKDFVAEGCGEFNSLTSGDLKDFAMDKALKVFAFSMGETELNDFVLRFSPPDGAIDYSLDGGTNWDEATEKTELMIGVRYGENEESRYQKQIIMDLFSGNLDRKNYE